MLEFASRQIKQDMEQFRVKGLQQERQHRSLLQDIDKQLEGVLSQRKANENRASIISEILDKTKTGWFILHILLSLQLVISYNSIHPLGFFCSEGPNNHENYQSSQAITSKNKKPKHATAVTWIFIKKN